VRADNVGIDDPDGGHESQHRRRADEAKSPLLQRGGERDRLGNLRGNLTRARGARVGLGAIGPHEVPQVRGGASPLVLARAQGERGPRVGDRGLDLTAVSDDSGIASEALDVCLAQGRDRVRREALERRAEGLAFGQHGAPGQARLESLEGQALEDARLVVDGHAPLRVVVGAQERVVGGPGRANEAVVAQREPAGERTGRIG
jgi:hypothetical protein